MDMGEFVRCLAIDALRALDPVQMGGVCVWGGGSALEGGVLPTPPSPNAESLERSTCTHSVGRL